MVSVHTKLISLLGYPLAQTFAPQMFNETFKALGMDYFYFPIEVEGEKLKTIVNAIRCMNYVGFNVTKPNKPAILKYLDDLDELAETIGSVNVVTIRDGVLKGYNTDGVAFVQALLDETGMDLSENTFLIFGAGGASRAVSSTLEQQDPEMCSVRPVRKRTGQGSHRTGRCSGKRDGDRNVSARGQHTNRQNVAAQGTVRR